MRWYLAGRMVIISIWIPCMLKGIMCQMTSLINLQQWHTCWARRPLLLMRTEPLQDRMNRDIWESKWPVQRLHTRFQAYEIPKLLFCDVIPWHRRLIMYAQIGYFDAGSEKKLNFEHGPVRVHQFVYFVTSQCSNNSHVIFSSPFALQVQKNIIKHIAHSVKSTHTWVWNICSFLYWCPLFICVSFQHISLSPSTTLL